MKTGNRVYKTLLYFLILALVLWGGITKTAKAAKTLSATISSETVEKGKTIHITAKEKNVAYKSSDTSIAYVNQRGVIVGKKKGTATITVSKSGYNAKNFTVNVTTNGKTPNIYVWYEEIELTEENLSDGIYTAKIRNKSKEALNKVEYVFEAVVETIEDTVNPIETNTGTTETNTDLEHKEAAQTEADQTKTGQVASETDEATSVTDDETISDSDNVPGPDASQNTSDAQIVTTNKIILKASASDISAGKTKGIKLKAPDNGKIKTMKLKEIRVHTKSALIVFDAKKNTYTYGWGTKDKTAPVISGLVGENSYCDDTIFMVVYPDKEYDFTKYVTAEDDRDLKVSVEVDTSKINYKKEGSYKIIYSAVDSAGNKSTADAKVYVRLPKKVDLMADEVLKSVVKDSMTDQEKISAVYKYIRKNFSYVGNYEEDNWEEAAQYGLRYKSGDCFMFYSVSRLLLTRLGIPNMMVTRSRGEGHHWWNLTYAEGGWYHFDTTPRIIQATFCLVTSAQLEEYSVKSGNTHIWDVTKYPETATKKISKVVMNKRY